MNTSDRGGGSEPNTSFEELADIERWTGHTGDGTDSRSPYQPADGPVFAVRVRTSDGMHRVVGISPEPVTEAEGAVLRSVAGAALDLAGHESGAARIDVVLTPRGPRIAAFRLGDAAQGADG